MVMEYKDAKNYIDKMVHTYANKPEALRDLFISIRMEAERMKARIRQERTFVYILVVLLAIELLK